MKKNSFFIILITICISFQIQAQTKQVFKPIQLKVSNQSNLSIEQKEVFVTLSKVSMHPNKQFIYPIVKNQLNQMIDAQLIQSSSIKKEKQLFFQANLNAHETATYTLSWTNIKPTIVNKVNIRFRKRTSKNGELVKLNSDTFYPNMLLKLIGFQPYQTDGPTWENNKVGFRHYFDGRNAKDVFGKRIEAISPDSVGISSKGEVEDNYHVLKDWGRDILPVGTANGLSVGLGGIGLLQKNQLYRIGVTANDSVHTVEATKLKIINNGPLYASFSIQYQNWKPNATSTYQVQEEPTIWPDMYAYQNTVNVQSLQLTDTLVVGLPKAATNKPLQTFETENWVVLYTHDYQTYNKEYILGMAIIIPKTTYQGWGKSPDAGAFASSYFAKLKPVSAKPITYYSVACWELSDVRFKNEEFFVTYLKSFIDKITATVQVKIITAK